MKLICTVRDSQIIFMSEAMRNFYMEFFKRFNNTDKTITIDLDEYSPYTSSEQQSLFNAMLLECSKICGHSFNELEDEMINLFAPFVYEKDLLQRNIKRRKQVFEMDNREFQIFLEQSNMYMINMFDLKFEL